MSHNFSFFFFQGSFSSSLAKRGFDGKPQMFTIFLVGKVFFGICLYIRRFLTNLPPPPLPTTTPKKKFKLVSGR